MTSDEIQRRIDQLSEQLRRSVVLNDPDVRLLYSSRHYGDEDQVRIKGVLHRDPGSQAIAYLLGLGVNQWASPGRIPAAPQLGMQARLLAPVRWHGELLGAVLVIDADESLSPVEMASIEDFAREAAGLIVGERHAADQRSQADEADVAAWLSRDEPARQRGRAGLVARGMLPDLMHTRVLVADAAPPSAAEEPRAALVLRHAFAALRGRVRGTPLSAVHGGHGALAIVSPSSLQDEQAEEAAQLVLDQISDFLGPAQVASIGIGAPADGIADAWKSCRQADLAVQAVPLLRAGPIAHWDTLGALQLLMRIPADELDATAVPAAVTALLGADPRGSLVETLKHYLRSGGVGSSAAAALHIHRTTLYYRLDRIREVTGLDIDDGDVRLQLHLGLAASRIIESRTAQ